ncbi:hypothetical protein Q31b_00850 [Novipirellula aureliae]|uniref:Plasmid related protein n=1 Tax=Novipirellula aureliae TaxID=2527966 RepID=A0A5C6E8M8_9BACT|nr:hypothetical protein [Novipirellula aureliae]TWU44914.1 hypothetical protein Q31b_00850 [Novipirellula aureliae]
MINQKPTNAKMPLPIILSKFPIGRLCATPGAEKTLEDYELHEMVQRHASCDWGDCCEHDRQANNNALLTGARLFSVYRNRSGEKIWVITEADRRSTTVLLPSEY